MRHCPTLATCLLTCALLWIPACGDGSGGGVSGGGERVTLTAWAHHGKPAEWRTIQQQVEQFNSSQDRVRVELVEIAEANYDTQVNAAAASGALPDILEFDGPMLANYAWKGYLAPMDEVIDPALRDELLPSIIEQGTYAGNLYAVGVFDSGLGLFVNRALIEQAGGRIPEGYEDAWSIEEFNQLLADLAAQEEQDGGDGRVLDIKRDYRGEWWTYGFYPILLSAGSDVIDRDDYQSATGVLNAPESVAALRHLGDWMGRGYVDKNTDGRAFVDERVAISWVGHWEYPRYREAIGEALHLVPLPDFGEGSRTASGSWCWSITRNCQDKEAAMAFIEFLLSEEQVLAMVEANGAVPATQQAVDASPLYQTGGPLHLYVQQLRTIAVPRPATPAYPVITSVFQEAMLNILEGGDVEAQLDAAVKAIDRDIEDNQGYPKAPG